LGSGNGVVDFGQVVTELTVGQVYHFRADIAGLGTTLHGNDQAFIMPGTPSPTTAAATLIHPGQAMLNATINPNSEATTYWFQHGLTTSYGSSTPSNMLAVGTRMVAVSNLVTGLPRGVTYHFCVVASNAFGLSYGADTYFNVPEGSTTPTGSTGGGVAFDIRQPALELNYLICTNGNDPNSGLTIPFYGEICLFAGNFAPAGWALCQGQLLTTNSNTELFSLIGALYGGDGKTNFALPDFRGCRALDAGTGQGLSPWYVGHRNGANQHTLSMIELSTHTHSLPSPYNATLFSGNGEPAPIGQPSMGLTGMLPVEGIYPSSSSNTIFEPFLGQIIFYAGVNTLSGTYPLSGLTLPVANNSALYSIFGMNYGGDGAAIFGLPDMQSRVPVGIGQGPLTFWSPGQQAGAEAALISLAQMPPHQHTVPALGTNTGMTGSNQPVGLIQPSLAFQFLISTNGQIPSTTAAATNKMVGEIQIYAGTNAPNGWLPCDGRLLQVSNASDLFSVISNYYGGDGISTFALPDMRGRVPVGSTSGQPGAVYGAEQTVLTVANLPPHTHAVPSLDFDRWITSFGLSGAAAAFTADADSDAAENGYEWATGTNPTDAQSFDRLTINSSGNNVLIGFPRNTNATDVVFTLLRSTNLAQPGAWTAIATNTAGVWTPSAIVTESGSTSPVNVNISDALTNAASANYRLQITWP
jgi:microcystin-dependent protein